MIHCDKQSFMQWQNNSRRDDIASQGASANFIDASNSACWPTNGAFMVQRGFDGHFSCRRGNNSTKLQGL